jgi:hypothetical protein
VVTADALMPSPGQAPPAVNATTQTRDNQPTFHRCLPSWEAVVHAPVALGHNTHASLLMRLLQDVAARPIPSRSDQAAHK